MLRNGIVILSGSGKRFEQYNPTFLDRLGTHNIEARNA